MRSRFKVLGKVLLSAALLGGAGRGQAQSASAVEGTVRDIHSAVVPNASIACATSVNSVETITDGSGHFSLDLSKCSTQELRISAKGFTTRSVSIGAAPTTELAIVLEPSAVGAIVTVSGVDTTIPDSPDSVLAIQRDDLRNPGAASVDESLRQIPGFTLFRRTSSRTANPTSQGVSLRGVGGSGASRAVVLLDGLPLNDPFGGWVYWGRIPYESIDQVEVLRGPGSDQYGSSAIGGVVSIRSRSPEPGERVSLDASYGTMRTPAISSYSSVGSQTVRGSVAAEFFRTDGYIPVAQESHGRVDTKANVGRFGVRPQIDLITSVGRAFIGGEFYEEVRANGTPLQTNDTRLKSIHFGLDRDMKRFGTVGVRLFDLAQEYHQSFSTMAGDRNSELLSRLQRVPSGAFGSNVRWTKDLKDQIVFAGLEYRRANGFSDETGFTAGRPSSRTETGGRQITAAGYAGGRLVFGRYTLNGTLRYDGSRQSEGRSIVRSLSGTTVSSTNFPARGESSLTGRASLMVRLSDRVRISAAYATGFREPTLNELYRGFRLGNVLTLANENLRAERAKDLEAAITFTGLSDRLYVRAGAYCISIKEAISNVTLSSTPSLITRRRDNLDSSHTCGLETEGKFSFASSLSLSADYLFVNSIVSASEGNPQLVGRRLPQVARHQFGMQLNWTPKTVGSFFVQLRGTGSQFDDDQNLFPLRKYAVLGAMYSRSLNRNIDFYGGIENAFNARVESGRTPVLTLGQPRTARLGLRLRLSRGQ